VADGPEVATLATVRRAYDLWATVAGVPEPQGSKRAFNHNGSGKVVMIDNNHGALTTWRTLVATAVRLERDHLGLPMLGSGARTWVWDEPMFLRLVFTMPRPARPKYVNAPGTKPDLDKLARAVLDALTDSRLIRDDALVIGFDRLVKVFPGMDPESLSEPGLRLYVRRAFGDPLQLGRELDAS
jgi:hypothetical protein